MQINRLARGGRVNRAKPLSFNFNGTRLQGFEGDTLASALLANGVDVVGRSFKYGRPRGIVGHGAEEPNAIVQLGSGAQTVPNLRATQVELYEGLEARTQVGIERPLHGLQAGLRVKARQQLGEGIDLSGPERARLEQRERVLAGGQSAHHDAVLVRLARPPARRRRIARGVLQRLQRHPPRVRRGYLDQSAQDSQVLFDVQLSTVEPPLPVTLSNGCREVIFTPVQGLVHGAEGRLWVVGYPGR